MFNVSHFQETPQRRVEEPIQANSPQSTTRKLREPVLKKQPKFARAHFQLGQISFKAKSIKESIKHYERCAQINEDYTFALLTLGLAYLQDQQQSKTLLTFAKILKKVIQVRTMAECYKIIRDYHASKLQYKKAQLCFREVLTLDKYHLLALSIIALMQFHLKQYLAIKQTCGKLFEQFHKLIYLGFGQIKTDNNWPFAIYIGYQMLIKAHLNLGQYYEAMDLILKATFEKDFLKINIALAYWLNQDEISSLGCSEEDSRLGWWSVCIERGCMKPQAFKYTILVLKRLGKVKEAIRRIEQYLSVRFIGYISTVASQQQK